MHHLTENALKVEDSDSSTIKAMKLEMAKNLTSRYKEPDVLKLLDFSCLADPRFKSMPFMDEYETNLLHEKFLAEKMMHVVSDAEQEEERPLSETENVDNTTEEEPTAKKPKTGLGKLLGDMFTRPEDRTRMSIREKAELEMKRYLQEPSSSIDENPLNWWKQNHSQFPAIAKLAKKWLCIPATSTPCERLFSKAGNIINAKRAALDSEMHPCYVF